MPGVVATNTVATNTVATNTVASKTAATRTYGTVPADRQKEMSGLEFVQGLAEGTVPLNTIAQTLGYDVAEAANGRVVVTAEPNDTHLNPAGTVHGGLAATLLDSCMGLAILSNSGERRRPDNSRIQDFTRAADHAADRPDHGRRRRAEPGPPRRHRRRPDHRRQRAPARAWHDDMPDFPGVTWSRRQNQAVRKRPT